MSGLGLRPRQNIRSSVDLVWHNSEEIAAVEKAVVITDQSRCHTRLNKLIENKESFCILLSSQKQQNNDESITVYATERTTNSHLSPMVFPCFYLVYE